MLKTLVETDVILLLGLSARTNNANELNPNTCQIGPLAQHYWQENIANTIPQRKNPGVTIAAYAQYASDERGDYSYFIGEAVSSLNNIPEGLSLLVIPAGKYQRLTTNPGKMPQVIIQAWQKIWKMTQNALGGKRNFIADYEVYDQRASDPENTVIDIYIGIK